MYTDRKLGEKKQQKNNQQVVLFSEQNEIQQQELDLIYDQYLDNDEKPSNLKKSFTLNKSPTQNVNSNKWKEKENKKLYSDNSKKNNLNTEEIFDYNTVILGLNNNAQNYGQRNSLKSSQSQNRIRNSKKQNTTLQQQTKNKISEIEKYYMVQSKQNKFNQMISQRPQTANIRKQTNTFKSNNITKENILTSKQTNQSHIVKAQQFSDQRHFLESNSQSSTTTSPKNSNQQLNNDIEQLVDKIQLKRQQQQQQQNNNDKSSQNQNSFSNNVSQSYNKQLQDKNTYNPQQFKQKKSVNQLNKRPQTAVRSKLPTQIQNNNNIQYQQHLTSVKTSQKVLITQENKNDKNNLEKLVDGMLNKATKNQKEKKLEQKTFLLEEEDEENNEKILQQNEINQNKQLLNKYKTQNNFYTKNNGNTIINSNTLLDKKQRATSANKRFYGNDEQNLKNIYSNTQQTINKNNIDTNHVLLAQNQNQPLKFRMKKPPVPKFNHPGQKVLKENNNDNMIIEGKNPDNDKTEDKKYERTNNLLQKGIMNQEKQKYQLNKRPTTAGAKRFGDNLVNRKLGLIDNLLAKEKYSSNTAQSNQNLIERYTFGNVIGKGSYAVVKIGTDIKTNQSVAIKTYDKFKLLDQQKRTNLRRETQILKFIDHPNIIKLFNTIDTRTSVSLVMEYIGQLTLRQFIKDSKEKRIREPEAAVIFSQVVHAISYLHQNNINHRDIKLENIMINPSNLDIRIIDFGFAIRSDKKLNIFCGTPSYMAPEIVKKQEYYGKPSDVWALGILLFAMLFGKFPFKGKDDHDLYRKIQKQDINIPSGISSRAQDLLSKIFKKNPEQRPDCMFILRHDWFKS